MRLFIKNIGNKKAGLHPFGPLVSDVLTDIHRIKHNKYRDEHPCQLPIYLLERIILMSTDEGDIVLDPFVGTGTTVIAAKRLGRRYIGFDIDEKYVKNAQFKLSKEKLNSKIGDIWVSWFLDGLTTIRDKDWEEPLNITSYQNLVIRLIAQQSNCGREKRLVCNVEAVQRSTTKQK